MNDRIYYSHEAKQQAQRQKMVLLMMVAGLSIGIGAMISLLFAPQSGDKTREQLNDQMSDAVHQGRKVAKNAGEQLRQNTEKMMENLNGQN